MTQVSNYYKSIALSISTYQTHNTYQAIVVYFIKLLRIGFLIVLIILLLEIRTLLQLKKLFT